MKGGQTVKILVIEDEKYIAKPIEQLLKKNHYSVDLAFNGEEGLELGLTNLYDLIILDIMLPRIDGITVLQTLRRQEINVPILMLTAKNHIEDKIIGLDKGADDYLAKPFDNQELLARLRALLRRGTEFHRENKLTLANIELNPHTLMLSNQNQSLKLTLKETQLLELLIHQKQMVTTKDLIIEKLWGFNSEASYAHVDYHVSLLRKKIKQLNSKICLKTIRGVGYIIMVENQ